jgi:ethanolamine utilization microcompartment shell protein EutL
MARLLADADIAVVCFINGERGSGFSIQMIAGSQRIAAQVLPGVLRSIADTIEEEALSANVDVGQRADEQAKKP